MIVAEKERRVTTLAQALGEERKILVARINYYERKLEDARLRVDAINILIDAADDIILNGPKSK